MTKLYPVVVTDTCSRIVLLEAENADAAMAKAAALNESGEIDVGYEFYIGSDYSIDEDFEVLDRDTESTDVFLRNE